MRTSMVAFLATACGSRAVATGHHTITPAALAPCPDDATLATTVRRRWKLDPAVPLELRCTPGHFGGDGWAVVARIHDATLLRRRIVLAASGDVVADGEAEPIDVQADSTGPLHAIDLDGDGVDELVEVYSHDAATWLAGFRVARGTITSIGTASLPCDATFEVAGGGAHVLATAPGPGCLAPGEHALGLDGGKLAIR